MFLVPKPRKTTNEIYNTLVNNAQSVMMSSLFPRVFGIAAVDQSGGIGLNDTIPWHSTEERAKNPELDKVIKNDMILFRTLTNNQVCIVGRKTYQNMIKLNPNIFNAKKDVYVITRQKLGQVNEFGDVFGEWFDTKHKFGTFVEVNNMITERVTYVGDIDRVFVLGGSEIYNLYNSLYYSFITTRIPGNFDCDIKLPVIKKGFFTMPQWDENFFIKYYGDNKMWGKTPAVTNQPITKLLKELSPNYIENRCVGHRTRNTYNYSFSIDIRNIIPLCPVRRQDLAMIFHELMWFIRGETDIRILQQKGINIWNANALDAAKRGISTCGNQKCPALNPADNEAPQNTECDSTGINYCGDCALNIGRTYGAQWRRFGDKHFDQLAYVIDQLKNNPYSRRIMLSSWCPPDIFNQACLPPCHVSYNFNVDENRNLYCQVLQRSSDIAVGLSWNIASAALLTHLLAKTCGLVAHTVSFTLCNAHLYESNEIATLALYSYNPDLSRGSYPKFEVVNKKEIEEYTLDDFIVHNYRPYSEVKLRMVV